MGDSGPDDTQHLTALLTAARWRWAHTYAKFLPHWYSVRSTWESPADFAWAAATINRLGERRAFGSPAKGRSFLYFDWLDDDGQAWTCWDCASELSNLIPVMVPTPAMLINKAKRWPGVPARPPTDLTPRLRKRRLPFEDGNESEEL